VPEIFRGDKGQLGPDDGKLNAIFEPIILKNFVSLIVSQLYGPPWPITGIVLPLTLFFLPFYDLQQIFNFQFLYIIQYQYYMELKLN
jgi:hypothetical protein